MQKFIIPIPLSLYIHIPWCVRKCPYCDFNSHQFKGNLPEEVYVEALLKDLEEQLPFVWGRRIISLFFGGGTPSLFSPQSIETILEGIHRLLPFGPDVEITLEANPGTVDESLFKDFRAAGINRLSLGIQSLQNKKLQALGRIHDREYALAAIDAAIQAGFRQFNLDLMHGLPNQSMNDALQDIEDALSYAPPHLSWYQLTLEPNTFFYRNPPLLPAEEVLWDIQEKGKNAILAGGLHHYEISAFARENHECQHNRNYWEFGDYLGIGAGAHSKITDVDQGAIFRHVQVKHPKDYLKKDRPLPMKKQMAESDVSFEFMLNALRLIKGVPVELFVERTGLPLESISPQLKLAKEKQLLCDDQKRLKPTELGFRFLNDLMALFLPNTKTDHNIYQ